MDIFGDVDRNLVSGKVVAVLGGGVKSSAPSPKYQPLHVLVPTCVTTIGRLLTCFRWACEHSEYMDSFDRLNKMQVLTSRIVQYKLSS